MKVLFPSSDGWPTKNLLGFCDSAVFEEAASLSMNLFDVYSSDWETRLEIALQV